jgi:glutaredoxin
MKNLIYKNDKFYLCDEINKKDGMTCIVSKYIASKSNMPHKQFKTKIVVYARDTCPYCVSFIEFLKKNNKNTGYYDNLIYIKIDSDSPDNIFSKSNILKNLKQDIKDHSTVPMVFYKSEFIGGADTSKAYFTDLFKSSK